MKIINFKNNKNNFGKTRQTPMLYFICPSLKSNKMKKTAGKFKYYTANLNKPGLKNLDISHIPETNNRNGIVLLKIIFTVLLLPITLLNGFKLNIYD